MEPFYPPLMREVFCSVPLVAFLAACGGDHPNAGGDAGGHLDGASDSSGGDATGIPDSNATDAHVDGSSDATTPMDASDASAPVDASDASTPMDASDASGALDAGGDSSDAATGCANDGDCGGATLRCDTTTHACVACLPVSDNCPSGQHCAITMGSYGCVAGCLTSASCSVDGGTAAAQCCNGGCVDTSTDPNNCMVCGNVCTPVETCVMGACGLHCATGTADCNGLPADGCETTLGTISDCAFCGDTCSLPQSTSNCVQNACTLTKCNVDWANCDMIVGNGCETHTSVDKGNCGACGNACMPAVDSWVTSTPMTTAQTSLAVGVVSGVLYGIGGDGGSGKLTTNEAYDPGTKVWSTKAPMPTARAFAATNAATVNGILYLVGGNPPGFCTGTVEAYDPVAGTWQTKASMPTPRCGVAVAALNGLIYAAGGTPTSGSVKYAVVEVYNPTTNTWASAPSMITCRQSPSAAVVGGKLFVVGGWAGPVGGTQCQTGNASGTIGANEVFDPIANSWTSKTAMPTVRSNAAIAVLNGRVFVLGGGNDTIGQLATSESYDPGADAWTTEVPLPSAIAGAGAGVIGSSIYLAGGYDGTSVSNALQVFTRASQCVGGVCG